jgi:DNA-binding Lrp family transcriptional regulator
MVMAVVMINVNVDETSRVAAQIAELPGITEVYSVAGNYDIVAIMRVKDNASIADLVSDKIRKVHGVARTETLIAFRAYSRFDLEGLFGLS